MALFEIQEPGEARAKEACATGAVGSRFIHRP